MLSFTEDNVVSVQFRGLRVVDQVESDKQLTTLFTHPALGRIMTINGEVQTVEQWQHFYHEPLVHLPMACLEQGTSVLILGGGDIFAATEALKYPGVKSVALCDYDIKVVELTEKHYPHARRALKDPRLNIVCDDLSSFLDSATGTYDVIVNDAIDPFILDDAAREKYFDNILRILSDRGVYSDLVYRSIYDQACTRRMVDKITGFTGYKNAFSFLTIPEYPGVFHVMAMMGKAEALSQDLKQTVNRQQIEWMRSGADVFEIFNPGCPGFYFSLPRSLRRELFENVR